MGHALRPLGAVDGTQLGTVVIERFRLLLGSTSCGPRLSREIIGVVGAGPAQGDPGPGRGRDLDIDDGDGLRQRVEEDGGDRLSLGLRGLT